MKPGFLPGVARELTIEVTEEMCPAFDGELLHRCYSTWSLVQHMEMAARRVLADFLEAHEEGIGAHVSVDHLAPSAVGRTVRVRAELAEVQGRRVVCHVTAHHEGRLLARGTQVQIVMDKDHLRRYLERS